MEKRSFEKKCPNGNVLTIDFYQLNWGVRTVTTMYYADTMKYHVLRTRKINGANMDSIINTRKKNGYLKDYKEIS